LTAIFTYQNGLGRNIPHEERFSFMTAGNSSILRQNTVPRNYEPGIRPIWIFDGSDTVSGPAGNCPLDATWIDCAVYLSSHANEPAPVVRGDEKFRYPAAKLTPVVCEFVLDVPKWEPSPDSPEKRRLALELLTELQQFGYKDARAIVIRDFNVNDPDVTAYVMGKDGKEDFQGCSFNAASSPHCWAWHMFGQSPVAGLRQKVMSRPYHLYPPTGHRR
jgi:hypothetical protein